MVNDKDIKARTEIALAHQILRHRRDVDGIPTADMLLNTCKADSDSVERRPQSYVVGIRVVHELERKYCNIMQIINSVMCISKFKLHV